MKTIHFIHSNMYMGGGEKALLRLLNSLDTSKYDVSLTLNYEGGELLPDIPGSVRTQIYPWDALAQDCAALPFLKYMRYCYYALRLRTVKDPKKVCWAARIWDLCHHVSADAVLAYAFAPLTTMLIGALSTARYKALWVHCLLDGDEDYYRPAAPFLQRYQTVFCVSEAVKDSFCRHFPACADKAVVMYNLICPQEIRELADELLIPTEPDTFTLCTVTRIAPGKGAELIPELVRRLTGDGYRVKWYLVGDGDNTEEVMRLAELYGVNDKIVFCGTLKNPYPYIKCCDVYVQPTRAEGFGLSVNEAKILCKPIVVTDLPCMHEQFIPNENAILTEGTADAFAAGIEKLLDSPELRERFSENLKSVRYDDQSEMDKLYAYIERYTGD